MTPPRTVRDIITPRAIPQSRYLKSLNRLGNAKVSLQKAPYSTREIQRTSINCHNNLIAPSYRHVFKLKVVPKSVRLQVAQIRKLGILEYKRKP